VKARVVIYAYQVHVRLLSPEPAVVETTTVYSGQGADIVMQSFRYWEHHVRFCD
jgi:hypothetical protein